MVNIISIIFPFNKAKKGQIFEWFTGTIFSCNRSIRFLSKKSKKCSFKILFFYLKRMLSKEKIEIMVHCCFDFSVLSSDIQDMVKDLQLQFH